MLDHLIYGAPDLEAAVDELAARLGVEPTPGGVHPGFGTRNALLSLGDRVYLEIVGPDPDQPRPERPRPFGLDELREPRLVGWCARVASGGDLDDLLRRGRAAGHDLAPARSMSRRRLDGVTLSWRIAFAADSAPSVLPSVMDWGGSPHPTAGLPAGLTLRSFRIGHPAPAGIRRVLDALGADVPVRFAPAGTLEAMLDSPRGPVTL